MAKRKLSASDYEGRPLCKHNCRDKDSCKHKLCCREHALRAARQPGPDDGGPVSPSTSKPPGGTPTPPPEGQTGGKDPLSPSGSIGGGKASPLPGPLGGSTPAPPPGPSGGDASGKTPSSGGSGGSGKKPREHPPAAQQLAEEAGDISSTSIETTQEIDVSSSEEDQTGTRDQPNFPAYRINDQDPDAPAVTADNYRPPLRYLYEIPGCSEVIGDGDLFTIIMCALPPQDIVRCRRVCKGWRVKIENAPRPGAATDGTRIDRFRRARFLEAETGPLKKSLIRPMDIAATRAAAEALYERDRCGYGERPEDAEIWQICQLQHQVVDEADDEVLRAVMRKQMPPTVIINPTLFTLRGKAVLELSPTENDSGGVDLDSHENESYYAGRRMCFRYDPFVDLVASDSRLEMFVTQPPVKEFRLTYARTRYVGPRWETPAQLNRDGCRIRGSESAPTGVDVRIPDGVRYRHVIDAITVMQAKGMVDDDDWPKGYEDIPWVTDMFRSDIAPVPKVDLRNMQTWGDQQVWDGSNDEPDWLYAWNLFRRDDMTWQWYCAYHRVMKLGLEACRGVIPEDLWKAFDAEFNPWFPDDADSDPRRDPHTETWWIAQMAGEAEFSKRKEALRQRTEGMPCDLENLPDRRFMAGD